MSAFVRSVRVYVNVTVNNPDAIDRCFTDEWRNSYYDFDSEEEVIDHFAFNAVANGLDDASLLDGWADLKAGEVTVEKTDYEVDS